MGWQFNYNRGLDLKHTDCNIFQVFNLQHKFIVEYKYHLYVTDTKLHGNKKYVIRKTIPHIRHPFESGYLGTVIWIPSSNIESKLLTKQNIKAGKTLEDMLNIGKTDIDFSDPHSHNSSQYS